MRYGILHVDLMNVESLHVDVVTRAWSPQRSRTRQRNVGFTRCRRLQLTPLA